LPEADAPQFLRHILEEESRHGLTNRIGMRMLFDHETSQKFLS